MNYWNRDAEENELEREKLALRLLAARHLLVRDDTLIG